MNNSLSISPPMKAFNNLKFSAKLWTFAAIMILAIIGSNSMAILGNRITNTTVQAYKSLAETNEVFKEKEIDHLKWIGVIKSAILSNAQTIDVQTDPSKCNLGRYLHSEDAQNLADQYPDIAQMIERIHPSHNGLHESAKSMQATWKQVHKGLHSELAERLDDHRIWLSNVSDSLLADETITVQSDCEKCKFGKWLQGEQVAKLSKEWPEFSEKIDNIRTPHRKLHQTVDAINAENDKTLKLRIFNEQTSVFIEEVAAIFSEIQSMEDELILAQESTLEIFENSTQKHLEDTKNQIWSISNALHEKQTTLDAKLKSVIKRLSIGSISLGITATFFALIISLFIVSLVTKPLKQCESFAKKLEHGDFTTRLDIDQNDEVGILAKALNKMVTGLREGFLEIKEGVRNMASSTTELSAISTQLAGNAEQSSMVSHSVAAATEQTSHNMGIVATSVEEMSSNLRSVATASEEMTSTIEEIAKNADRGRQVTEIAVQKVEQTSIQMNELGKAAELIGSITLTIKGISDQTNLLALNATIEAASAGEAGKGFAVVANEIKELSRQTAQATEQISESISNIQTTTQGSIQEISGIVEIINEIDTITTMIASAVEEQSNTTNEIATNVAHTADGVQEVASNVNQVNEVSADIAKDFDQVNQASNEIAAASAQLNNSATELSEFAERLNEITENYKV